jgi:DNA-binding MarR family transcriptional regulator
LNVAVGRLNAPFQQFLHQKGFTLTHWRVLAFLVEHDGLPVRELALRTATDPSTLSRALLRMERNGLIDRLGRGKDSRVVEVYVTDQGRLAFAAILPTALAMNRAALRGICPSDQQTMIAVLEGMLRNLG